VAGDYGVQPLKGMLSEKGVTQAEAAKAVGRTVGSLSQIVNGVARPTLPVAAQLARLVGRPIEELFTPKMLGLSQRRQATYKTEIIRSGRGWRFKCSCGTRGRWNEDRGEASRLAQQHRLRKHKS